MTRKYQTRDETRTTRTGKQSLHHSIDHVAMKNFSSSLNQVHKGKYTRILNWKMLSNGWQYETVNDSIIDDIGRRGFDNLGSWMIMTVRWNSVKCLILLPLLLLSNLFFSSCLGSYLLLILFLSSLRCCKTVKMQCHNNSVFRIFL